MFWIINAYQRHFFYSSGICRSSFCSRTGKLQICLELIGSQEEEVQHVKEEYV